MTLFREDPAPISLDPGSEAFYFHGQGSFLKYLADYSWTYWLYLNLAFAVQDDPIEDPTSRVVSERPCVS